MIYGEDCEQLRLKRIGEILGIGTLTGNVENVSDVEITVQSRVPSAQQIKSGGKALRIQVFQAGASSFFARPTPLIFYSSTDWGKVTIEESELDPPKIRSPWERG